MPRHVLFLLGMHAGGASGPAACLARAGAALGAHVGAPGDEGNAGEEAAPLAPLSDTILARLGLDWDTPVALPERWSSASALSPFARRADAVVAQAFGDAEMVVVAEPRLCRIFPIWRDAFERAGFSPSVALVVKEPRKLVNALARQYQFAPEKSLALWYHHLVEAERMSRDVRRTLITEDQWHREPLTVLQRLAKEAQFPLAGTAPAREAAETATAAAGSNGDTEPAAAATGRGLQSGLDAALEAGYAKLAALGARVDPRQAIEALATAARPGLIAAIPPWLEAELQAGRLNLARLDTELAVRDEFLLSARTEIERLSVHLPADAAVLSQQLEALRDQGQRERETLIDELTKTRGEMVQLTTAMSEAPRAAAALRDELAQAHRDLFDERASISRLTDEIEKVRRDADGNAQRFESSRHHLEALASELAQTREALQAREHDFAVVADEVDALRVQIADVQTETDAALRARDQAQRQLSRAQAERDTARHALDVAAAERAAAEEGIRQSGQALQALRDELPRRATAEASLARERDSAMTSLRTVSEKLAAVEAILAERNAYIAELVRRHNGLAKRLLTLEKRRLVRAAMWMSRERPRNPED